MVVYDLHNGIKAKRWQYIIMLFITLILVLIMVFRYQTYYKLGRIDGQFSMIDILLYWFRGTMPINPENIKDFNITDQYLFMNVYMAFIIGNYIVKDLDGVGIQVLCRTQRTIWWRSKVIWNVCTVLMFFACIYTLIFIVCLVHPNGTVGLSLNQEFIKLIGYNISDLEIGINMFATIIIMPIVSMLEISLLQMLVALTVSPIVGYILVIVQMIFSIFYTGFLLPGNGLMLIRNEMFLSGGVSTISVIAGGFIIWIMAYIIGYIYSDKFDIMNINRM